MTKSIHFLSVCNKCGAKCCKMGGPTFTAKEMEQVLRHGYPDRFFKVRNGFFEVKNTNGRCAYLKKDNSCQIHDVKPILCQCWPVFPDFKGRSGRYVIFDCPLTKVLSAKEIQGCKKEAAKVSKELLKVAMDYSTLPKKEAEILKRGFQKFKVRSLS